jgi:serine phosphatase RsbU (regulator of sigma subunit)
MRDLLPPPLHGLHGIEFAGGYRASKDYEVVGGDFYDFHPAARPEDETLVVLGDVCGKGLEAAVMTGKIRNTLQALTPLAQDHEGVLTLLNRAMLSSDHTRCHVGARLRRLPGRSGVAAVDLRRASPTLDRA